MFSYGLLLLGLIAKRVDLKEDLVTLNYETLDEWAYKVDEPQCSLVHTELRDDKDFDKSDGIALTELAMRCIQEDNAKERPTMSQVVKSLENLSAFQVLSEHAHKDEMMKLRDK